MSQNKERFLYYLAQYEGLVFANALNFVDNQWVEDVAQDTFMKMYEHLDYLEDDRVKNWLIVVSGNIAKNYLKKGGSHLVEQMGLTDLELRMKEHHDSAEDCVLKEEKQKAGTNGNDDLPKLEGIPQSIGLIGHIKQNEGEEKTKAVGDHIGKMETVPNIIQLSN